MGDYLDIIFGTSTAAPKAVEYDRCMIIGDGSPSTLSESNIYELDPSDWQTQLQADGFSLGDQLYDSVSIFFAASPSPQRLWVYAYISGAETCYSNIPLDYIGGDQWTVPVGPPRRFNGDERVRFYCCGDDIGTGYTWNYADASFGIGWTPEQDAAGNWTGKIDFPDGLTGENCGIVKPLTSDCKVTLDYCIGSEGGIGEALSDFQINMCSLSLENEATLKNYADNLFGSQLQDMMKMSSIISGKNCIWFYALPGDVNPSDTIQGTANTWGELKNLIGARQDIATLKAKPSALNHDMAAGYMAMTVISHPHTTMTFAEPHMGIQEQEVKINRSQWKDSQIASMMQWTELSGDPFLVTFGFTFGSGDVARVSGTRCRFIIAQTLINNLKGLLAKRTTLMSYGGCQEIKATIEATFKMLKDERIVDGFVGTYIPIETDLRDNTTAGRIARAQRTIPVVEVGYLFYTSVEKIRITRAENLAT